jgi:hypothetical protein
VGFHVKDMENAGLQELQEAAVSGIEGKAARIRHSLMRERSYSLGSTYRAIELGTYQINRKYSDIIFY